MTALPKLASPANRALEAAGVFQLEDLTKFSQQEITAWHGIGPNAIRTLQTALSAAGLSLAK